MASEAVLIHETELPIPFTVADGTGIEKGALLKMTDPMTAALADGDNDIVAGIAAEEKIASDGKTKLAVYRGGVFRVLAGTSISIGEAVNTHASTGATNEVAVAGTNDENVLGVALETAADTDTFLMELRPTRMELA
tara:strand:+ start:694 stop:1104 length:411 start_codon:yes stop_codon:yes gene_type:complete